jgi:hypothetical protein
MTGRITFITDSGRPQRPSDFSNALIAAATLGVLVGLPTMFPPHKSPYKDYTQDVSPHVISGSLTILVLFKEVANLIPHAGPLAQILGATKALIWIINELQDNKDACEHLVERVLIFMKGLIAELNEMNEPVRDGTPTAARLYTLLW